MGFAGNLRTLALPEVLQTLNRIKATGVLRLAAAEGGRDVVFDQGELIGVSFRRGEERQALLRRLILEGRLDATTAAQISSSGRELPIIPIGDFLPGRFPRWVITLERDCTFVA